MRELSPDTETILLLCGWFGKPQESGIKPLEPREYNALAAWLVQRGMRPADLLSGGDPSDQDPPVETSRLSALLERGGALALAVESWTSRGLWVISRSDETYPARLRRLGSLAPPLLYGAGDLDLLSGDRSALAIVGSRDVDEEAQEFTQIVAHRAGRQGIQIVSGGARGVDSAAMFAALDAGGTAVGVLADSLARASVAGRNGAALAEGEMTFLSSYDPNSGFSVGNAMGRNKYIYALADVALVVSTATGTGGTWAGAIEALKRGTTPVFVRLDESAPPGNGKLLEEGAHAFPDDALEDLEEWLARAREQVESEEPQVKQGELW